MTNEIATFDSSKTNKKSAGWLTTNHITGEKSRVLLIPIQYKKRYAKVFEEKGKDCYFNMISAIFGIRERRTVLGLRTTGLTNERDQSLDTWSVEGGPTSIQKKVTREKLRKKSLICTKKISIKCSKMQHISHLAGRTFLMSHNLCFYDFDRFRWKYKNTRQRLPSTDCLQ